MVTGQRKIIYIVPEGWPSRLKYSLPCGVHVKMREGDRVRTTKAPRRPSDVPSIYLYSKGS